jgi:basic membrane lipoprotein Med (substrate-binding protein (PBP1-ABC) superfamily)
MFIRIMLIRMNLRTILAAPIAALAVAGCTTAAAAGPHHDKVVVVLGGEAAKSPALIERAQAAAERAGAQLRVPHTSTEELGVTHLFAARGYDTIVAIDLDRHVSVDPVAERYPGVRFTSTLP